MVEKMEGMIARVFPPAASFRRVCWYVAHDKTRSEALYLEGVRGHDSRLMAQDFETIRALRPRRSNPVFHSVLLFHDQEKLDDAKMVTIAREYLQAIGYKDTQYAIVKHADSSHVHLHLVANRIGYNGKYIENFPEMLKSRDASQQLIRKYNLIPTGQKNLSQTNWDGLDNPEKKRYAIYQHIMECLPGCLNLDELEQRLLQRGVDTRYHRDPNTNAPRGISFRYLNEAFKGSCIDSAFSLPRLQQTLALQQQISIGESERKEQSIRLQQGNRHRIRRAF